MTNPFTSFSFSRKKKSTNLCLCCASMNLKSIIHTENGSASKRYERKRGKSQRNWLIKKCRDCLHTRMYRELFHWYARRLENKISRARRRIFPWRLLCHPINCQFIYFNKFNKEEIFVILCFIILVFLGRFASNATEILKSTEFGKERIRERVLKLALTLWLNKQTIPPFKQWFLSFTFPGGPKRIKYSTPTFLDLLMFFFSLFSFLYY